MSSSDERDPAAARRYHALTSHSEERLRADRHRLDWENEPLPFKLYPDLEALPLPREWTELSIPALRAIADPASAARGARVPDLAALARLLFCAAGITRVRRLAGGGQVHFRAYPNTGALFHIDLYLACAELPGLPAGLYHFGPHDFALRRLRAGDWRGALAEAAGAEPRIADAPLLVVSSSTYWRNAWKYRARAYRHCFWDAGTLHANLLAAANADRLEPHVVVGFADAPVEQLLGLDPQREGALTLVALGRGTSAPAAPPGDPLALATEPLSAREVDYPEIRALHSASSLASGAEAARWRGGSALRSDALARGEFFPLPPGPDPRGESLESVIRRRGSTREFDPAARLGLAELAGVLRCASSPLACDFLEPADASLLDLYLIVHAVDGLPPGTYHYRSTECALELLAAGELRAQAGRLGLFQELPAQACANLYWLAPLDAVLERYGNRGYRAAQLEGGIRGGRAYLAAYAQGFGATGLTFLDDEVVELFSPHARGKAVMFLVALGRSRSSRPRGR